MKNKNNLKSDVKKLSKFSNGMKTIRTIFYGMFSERLLLSKILVCSFLIVIVSSVFFSGTVKASATCPGIDMDGWSNWTIGGLTNCFFYDGGKTKGQVMNIKMGMIDPSGKTVASYIYFPYSTPSYGKLQSTANVAPGYIASCSKPSTCVATATPNAPMTPGIYWIGFAGCGTFSTGNFGCVISTQPVVVTGLGNINVSSNIPASWTITGPATITGSGTSQSSLSKPTGTYTITWGAVAGYTKPVTQNLALADGGTINFRGTYVAIPTVGTVNVSSNISSSWTIAGPAALSGSGTSANYTSKPTGSYTITWGDVSGYTKPTSSSLPLAAGGIINFNGNYTACTYVCGSTMPSCPTTVGSLYCLDSCTGDYTLQTNCTSCPTPTTISCTSGLKSGTWREVTP